jgi:23S rRNA (guanosine2251-2'-O)-methyltransferase
MNKFTQRTPYKGHQVPYRPAHKGPVYIYGTNTVREALTNASHAVRELYIEPSTNSDIKQMAHAKGVLYSELQPKRLPHGVDDDAVHQGVVARVHLESLLVELSDIFEGKEMDASTCMVLLAGLQDPQNVGAIIRTAGAFGVRAVLVPEHRQAPVTAAVAKVSSGMVFRVPLATVGNINQTIKALKEKGFWVYGLAGGGTSELPKVKFDRPTVIVVGNEGEGLAQKTMEHCDEVLTIPMHAQCESLNAATAVSLALYAWSAQHPEALQ